MVPGWDGARKEYVDLDCEGWIRENGIRKAGRENGEHNYPASEAAQPDDVYMKILDWVNRRGKDCHAAVSTFLVQQRHALEMETKKGMAPIRHRVEGLREEGILKLQDKAERDGARLVQLEKEARDAWSALKRFRNRWGLDQVAEYDGRETWYYWLVGVIVIEAIANAAMLAGMNEYGWLGALSIMLAIGLVNAGGLGAMIGEGWRIKNSVARLPRMAGLALVCTGLATMVCWNLIVGHFRDSMQAVMVRGTTARSLEELLTDDTIERFLASPLGLEGMTSWVLAAVGGGFCIFAATKWFGRDDAYPGYGKLHRVATERNEDYREDVTQRRLELGEIYSDYVKRIRDERYQVQNRRGNYTLITQTANEIIRQFPMHLSQYQLNLDYILSAYRAENERARSTPPPAFFDEKFTIDSAILSPPTWENPPESDYDEDWAGFKEAEDVIRDAYKKEQTGYPTLEDIMAGDGAQQ